MVQLTPILAVSFPYPHVAVVQMEDRATSNQITQHLVESMMSGFAILSSDPAVRVIVLHGFDSIFCTGGTQDELLHLVKEGSRFDAVPFYRLLLDCEVPVIAAMQGHALGGGLVFGLYADVVILAEEAVYSANFMKYGFTPGMGATCILPKRFGSAIASAMMFTAQTYRGSQLRELGVPVSILKRSEVIPSALRIAREIADKPRLSLTLLKQALTNQLRTELPAAVQAEIEMHQVTFAQPGICERIQTEFDR